MSITKITRYFYTILSIEMFNAVKMLKDELTKHLQETLPRAAELVLDMKKILTEPIRLMESYGKHVKLHPRVHSVFTQQQVACMVAGGLFCVFPGRSSARLHCNSYYANYPCFSFLE
jgi:hypothetical protein